MAMFGWLKWFRSAEGSRCAEIFVNGFTISQPFRVYVFCLDSTQGSPLHDDSLLNAHVADAAAVMVLANK